MIDLIASLCSPTVNGKCSEYFLPFQKNPVMFSK